MAIDVENRTPRLSAGSGGLSGPAIRPIALKLVWDAARVVKIPIIGTGGICDGADAIQFILAGATAVSVGSMTFRQPDAAVQVIEEIEAYLNRHEIGDVNDLIGQLRDAPK